MSEGTFSHIAVQMYVALANVKKSREMDTILGEAVMSEMFCLPSEKGPTQKTAGKYHVYPSPLICAFDDLT